ncbi:MAG: class I SAM-dependent methyltransferase [Halioglobus sp.]
MAKTGNDNLPGTAEGAALGRAIHAHSADQPVLSDTWAIHLLADEDRKRVASQGSDGMHAIEGFDASPVFAVNVGCLRYAEDAVDAAIAAGIDQYLILGAGFDTFALRRSDAVGRVTVFEIDHPDVQALKRERISAAPVTPAALPRFIPIDFETQTIRGVLRDSGFDPSRPCIVSLVNTLHYLTEEATRRSLAELGECLVPGSRLVLNYGPDVDLTESQLDFIVRLLEVTSSAGETMRSRWKPADFAAMLAEYGFTVSEHIDEDVLIARYFAGRDDGLSPGIPLRALVAERV